MTTKPVVSLRPVKPRPGWFMCPECRRPVDWYDAVYLYNRAPVMANARCVPCALEDPRARSVRLVVQERLEGFKGAPLDP